MPKNAPLPLSEPVGAANDVDPVDVIVTKRSLSRLGHYDEKKHGLTPFPDKELFAGIRNFQADQKLVVDGVMKPEGVTARRLGSLLFSASAPEIPRSPLQRNSVGISSPTPEQCDYLFYKVDVPVCNALKLRRGNRAAAICYHTAAARYAACLKGVPNNELPPLGTGNQ